ncbi:MAG: GntR family transcriptional regulator, partial [Acutalibacteraceae bacterium]|nr:GntR family transcriptional regulator [Acutalibacteraceae bacterium]
MIEHKTISLADQVFDHLENDILSGKYQRGEVLTESKLCAEMGVSRTPIREALRRLEQEHIIEESGKGSVVIGINEKDLEDIFLIRKSLECMAASLAAKNRTDEQLKDLKEALEFQEFYLHKNDPDQIKLMDNRFHETLYKLSGSTTFYDTLVPLHKKIQKYRRASVENSSRAAASVAEHRKIYEAIEAQNSTAAAKYASEHVENAYRHIM